MWKFIERVTAVWGFLAILAVIADTLNLLPYYDIYYKKKTDITPTLLVYPGQKVRLSAQFASSVSSPSIESVSWSLKDSAGRSYPDLPQLRDVDVGLLPDYSGLVNVEVKAKVRGESSVWSGSSSFEVVQTSPYQLKIGSNGTFIIPSSWKAPAGDDVQLYAGQLKWVNASAEPTDPSAIELTVKGLGLPLWDGKALVRYRPVNDPTGAFRYDALTAVVPAEKGG